MIGYKHSQAHQCQHRPMPGTARCRHLPGSRAHPDARGQQLSVPSKESPGRAGRSDHGRDHRSPSQPPGEAAAPAVPGAASRRCRLGASGDRRAARHRGCARPGTRPCRLPDGNAGRRATPRAGTARKLTTSDPSTAHTKRPAHGTPGRGPCPPGPLLAHPHRFGGLAGPAPKEIVMNRIRLPIRPALMVAGVC